MSGHARLGPSNHRWPHCPGSIREEAPYPDIAGTAAIDGTGSHLLLEMCLQNGVRAESYDGQIIGANHEDNPMGWLVSIDRVERVQQGLDYVSRRHAELTKEYAGCTIKITAESHSNPGEKIGRDDWWGTVDITIEVMNASNTAVFLEVIDYKDGRGWVGAKDNTQLLSYIIGKMGHLIDGLPQCRATIVQPKTNPSVRYDEPSTGAMRYHIKTLTAAAAATDDPNAPLVSGDHCTWCKHGRAKNCTAKSEQALGRVSGMENKNVSGNLFEIIGQTFGDITLMPSEKLEELADAKAGLMEVFERVDIELQRRVEDPEDTTVTGYAMLPGRGSSGWNADEEVIVKMLKGRRLKKDDIYPAKLISPAQVMKLDILNDDQKKAIKKKFIVNTPGKKTLKQVRQSAEPADKTAIFADVGTADAAPVSFI